MMHLALVPLFFLFALRSVNAQATLNANAFLAPTLSEGMSAADARALAQEIESLLGQQSTQGKLRQLEDALHPNYVSLAGGQRGLKNAAARYSLHRYFQQRHGWSVPGLDPEGGAWTSSSPAAILEGRAPAHLQRVFEDRLKEGMDLHELAVLAATFEHLVRVETSARLEKAFRAMEIPLWALLTDPYFTDVLEMYMLINYFGDQIGENASMLRTVAGRANELISGWSDTQLFLHDSSMSLAYVERGQRNPFVRWQYGFDDVLHVVEEVNSVYGMFQDKECQHLKSILLPHEDRGTGRVPLGRFHGLARAGLVQFKERKEYLRDLGVLDESDPGKPMVRIANWLLSPSNCLGSSAFYSYCCVNECNSIMAHLEHNVGAPRAGPEQLADVVARHSSSTVAAPRNISAVMLGRLHEIAASQGGTVALHGHLFAEWLHSAFPRECPYPHKAGARRALPPREWAAAWGQGSSLLGHELQAVGDYIDPADLHGGPLHDLDWELAVMDSGAEQLTQWTDEEENFVSLDVEDETGLAMLVLRIALAASSVLAVGRMLAQQLLSTGVRASEQPLKGAV